MPYLIRIDFLNNLTKPPRVIFTTAYEKNAIQGFEPEVLDYLIKPISYERFLKAANKSYAFFQSQQNVQLVQDYIYVKEGNRLVKVNFSDILFIEALENYMAIYTRDKKNNCPSDIKNAAGEIAGTIIYRTSQVLGGGD